MYFGLFTLICFRHVEVSPEVQKQKLEAISRQNSIEPKPKPQTIEEDVKEGEAEDEEGVTTYPYERLKTTSTDPVADIDVTKREVLIGIVVPHSLVASS